MSLSRSLGSALVQQDQNTTTTLCLEKTHRTLIHSLFMEPGVKEPEIRSKDPVDVSAHPHWCIDATQRSNPAPPDSVAENGFSLPDSAMQRISLIYMGCGFSGELSSHERVLDST